MERKLTDFIGSSHQENKTLTREELERVDEKIEGYLRELGY